MSVTLPDLRGKNRVTCLLVEYEYAENEPQKRQQVGDEEEQRQQQGQGQGQVQGNPGQKIRVDKDGVMNVISTKMGSRS